MKSNCGTDIGYDQLTQEQHRKEKLLKSSKQSKLRVESIVHQSIEFLLEELSRFGAVQFQSVSEVEILCELCSSAQVAEAVLPGQFYRDSLTVKTEQTTE